MDVRRLLASLVVALAGLAAAPAPALASCVEQTLSEHAARAEVIVYGTVTETRQTFVAAGGVIRFLPQRVLKGTLAREVEVNLGPTHGGPPTSVDYTAVIRGEGHTLYLRSLGDGSYETDACSGSHPGAPTPDEEKLLGTGTLVAAAREGSLDPLVTAVSLAAIVVVVAALGLLLRRRRRPA